MTSPANVEPGQRWMSNIGGPTLIVLDKPVNRDARWLVRSEDDRVMTTIEEWQLLDDYHLAGADDTAD